MSYRISPSVLGSLTLTGCEVGSTQWQGREIEQLVCLDEPIPYDDYVYEIYYNCQNSDVISTPLPVSGSLFYNVYTYQYFLDLSHRMGTFIVQYSIYINNKSYISSYFLQAQIEYQSSRIILDFGYPNLECEMHPNILRCSWYEGVSIIFEPATTDIALFD